MEPPGKNIFAWIFRVMRTKEETLVDKLGIDAAVYVRFEMMLRNAFLIFSVVGCAVAIPINVYFNIHSKTSDNLTASDAFRLMTPSSVSGMPLLAHVILGYCFNTIFMAFLWINYRKVVDIRRRQFMSREYQNSLFMRTLLITQIPKKYLSEPGVAGLLQQMRVSRPIQQISIGHNVKDITLLIEKHKDTITSLEKVLAKYLKHPDRIPAKRPVCRPAKEDRAEYGKRVDAIEYYINRSQRLEKQIAAARDEVDSMQPLPYGLVSYASPEDSSLVAKYMGKRKKNHLRAHLAPRPEDILWKNIVLNSFERKTKAFWGNAMYVFLMIAWIVPNAFIGCFLTQMSRIGQLSSTFDDFMKSHQTLFAVLQGFLAPAITALVFMILPTIMRRMSQWQGRITKTKREHDVTLKLFAFFFFNNFFVLTFFSVVWNIRGLVVELQDSDTSISWQEAVSQMSQNISNAIISSSSFWIVYLMRANLGALLDVLQVLTLFWNTVQRRLFSPTPREIMLATAPQPFQYAAYYNWLLFYSTIALAFTSIQPLILPVVAFYLCIDQVLKKYSLMYMFVTKVESDGMYWPLLNNCLLFGLAIGNLVLLAVVWVEGGFELAMAVVPLPVSVIIFRIVQGRVFKDLFYYFIPTDSEREILDIQASMNNSWEKRSSLEQRYLNPAINKRLMVPMVHARSEHMLKTVCAVDSMGSLDGFEYEANPFLPGNKHLRNNADNRRSVINENKFDLVRENELDYEHYQEIVEDAPTSHELTTLDQSTENLRDGQKHNDPYIDSAYGGHELTPPPQSYFNHRNDSFASLQQMDSRADTLGSTKGVIPSSAMDDQDLDDRVLLNPYYRKE